MLRGLVKLISYMDGLNQPADLQKVAALLRNADVSREDMVVACKFNDKAYARNEIAKSKWYQLLIICWKSGQASPIHDHVGSACGVRVVDGVATETIYQETKAGFVTPVKSHQYQAGQVCVTSDDDIHLITNEQRNQDLITLHLYTPPLRMSYYELDDRFDFS